MREVRVESKERLQQYLVEIEKWEKDQKGLWFWDKISRLPFKILDRFTPKFIQEKLNQMIGELGKYVQTGGQYLVSEKGVLSRVERHTNIPLTTIEEVGQLSIDQMTELTEQIVNERKKFATVQGATTGIGGIFTLAIDVPAVLGTALKTLQEIAILHGYDPKKDEERVFIVKCLQFASSDIVGKEAILNELSRLQKNSNDKEEMISQLKGWQEVFYTYRDQYGWKKLFQMIPVIGIVFGAVANKGMIEDVSEVGMMLYRKRRVYEKMQKYNQSV